MKLVKQLFLIGVVMSGSWNAYADWQIMGGSGENRFSAPKAESPYTISDAESSMLTGSYALITTPGGFSLYSGLALLQNGYKYSESTPAQPTADGGTITRSGDGSGTLTYLSPTMKVQWDVAVNQHIGLNASVGGMVPLLIHKSSGYSVVDGRQEKPDFNVRPYNLDLMIGVGATLKIADHYALTGNLDYVQQAFDTANDKNYKLRANQTLLSVGIAYHID